MPSLRNVFKTMGRVACAIVGGIAGLIIGTVFVAILVCFGTPGWLVLAGAVVGGVCGAIVCTIYTPLAEMALEIISAVVERVTTILKAIADLFSAFSP